MLSVVYFKESNYQAGHFQSIFPVKDSVTLEAIRDGGGFDVAAFYNFPTNGEFDTVSRLCSLNPY